MLTCQTVTLASRDINANLLLWHYGYDSSGWSDNALDSH